MTNRKTEILSGIIGIMIILYQLPIFIESLTCTVDTNTGKCMSVEDARTKHIEWKAEVLGCLVSCHGLSLRNIETSNKFQAYFQDDDVYSGSLYDTVLVRGVLTGTDCAYANTVFDGKCTPSVEISSIEPVRP